MDRINLYVILINLAMLSGTVAAAIALNHRERRRALRRPAARPAAPRPRRRATSPVPLYARRTLAKGLRLDVKTVTVDECIQALCSKYGLAS
jgi:hypothetical protein